MLCLGLRREIRPLSRKRTPSFTSHMNRSQTISSILRNRHQRVEEVRKRSEYLSTLRSDRDTMIALKEQLIPHMKDDAARARMAQVDEALSKVTGNLNRMETILRRLEARFQRKTLNIGVVGRPKQGKSTFLQSLTGLDEATVPTGDVWVTGAPSYLRNDPCTTETYAMIQPYTREEFLQEVLNPFFQELGMRTLNSPDELPRCQIAKVEGTFNDKKRKRLLDLQAHYREYCDLLGKPSFRVSKEEIRKYVSQSDLSGNLCYRWYAIRHAEVHCRFPQDDVGDVMVCDTPGLGDFTAGADKKLTKTMYEEMDVMFMIKRLDRNNQNVDEQDAEFIDTINGESIAYKAGEWTYIIVNKRAGEEILPSYREGLINDLKCPRLVELNAKDESMVANEFNGILEDVLRQLPNLDALLCKDYDVRKKELDESVRELIDAAEQAVKKAVPSSSRGAVREKTENLIVNLTKKLTALKEEYRVESDELPAFMEALQEVFDSMKTRPKLPSNSHEEINPGLWMLQSMTSMRAHFLNHFLQLDFVLEEQISHLRTRIMEILRSPDGGNLDFVTDGAEIKSEHDFWPLLRAALEEDDEDGQRTYWLKAIDSLTDIRLTFKAFLLPHILSMLNVFDQQIKNSDPRSPLLQSLRTFSPGDTIADCRRKLDSLWDYVRDEVENMVMYKDSENTEARAAVTVPARALSAIVDEFFLSWLFGGGHNACVRCWEDFCEEHRELMWPSEFDSKSSPFVIGRQWRECVANMKKKLSQF